VAAVTARIPVQSFVARSAVTASAFVVVLAALKASAEAKQNEGDNKRTDHQRLWDNIDWFLLVAEESNPPLDIGE
jgi:hypothetical protein